MHFEVMAKLTCWLLWLICLESALFAEMKWISLVMICAKCTILHGHCSSVYFVSHLFILFLL